MALLELRDIGKIYVSNQNVAVGIRGVNLSFDRGEFVAVTGKSGSGKSTLLNIISGMDTYEEGELLIDNASGLEELLEKDPIMREEYRINKKLKNDPRVTQVGKIIRKLMIDRDETLKDLAELFDVSKAFVSSVLIGKKPVPKNWLDAISSHYELDADKIKELNDAYDETKKTVKIDVTDCDTEKKKLVLQFQRKLNSLTDEEAEFIAKILGKEGK